MQNRIAHTIVALLTIVAVACSEDGTDSAGAHSSSEACSLEMSVEAATPGTRIELLNAADLPVPATVSFTSEQGDAVALVTDGGFVVPFHANGSRGGRYHVEVLGAESSCDVSVLDVLPVEARSGAFREWVESSRALWALVLERHGSTPERARELTGRRELTAEEYMLAEGQWQLDHPDNPNSLNQMVESLDPELERELDALFGAAALGAQVEAYRAEGFEGGFTFGVATAAGALQRNDISSPAQLSRAMAESYVWCGADNNAFDKVIAPMVGLFSFAGPWGKVLSLIVGAISFTHTKYAAFICATRPAHLTGLWVGREHVKLLEDQTLPEPIGGQWSVSAETGPPMNLLMAAAEAALLVVGVKEFVKPAGQAAASTRVLDDFDFVGGTKVSPWATGATVHGSKITDGTRAISIGGDVFPEIRGFNSTDWSRGVAGSAVAQAVSCGAAKDHCVKQLSTGESYIMYEPRASSFPSRTPMPKESVSVDVEEIKINLSDRIQLFRQTGDGGVYFTVENAEDTSVRWYTDNSAVELWVDQTFVDQGRIDFTVHDLEALPATIYAESTSPGALGVRRSALIIDTVGIAIITTPGCIEPGDTAQLEAVTTNLDGEIEWRVDRGTVSKTGLYTATSAGPVEVNAITTVEGVEALDAAEFVVQEDCTCRSELQISNDFPVRNQFEFYLTALTTASPSMVTLDGLFPDGTEISILWESPIDRDSLSGRWPVSQFGVLRDGLRYGAGDTGFVDVRLEGDRMVVEAQLLGEFEPDGGQRWVKARFFAFAPRTEHGTPLQNSACHAEENLERWRGPF